MNAIYRIFGYLKKEKGLQYRPALSILPLNFKWVFRYTKITFWYLKKSRNFELFWEKLSSEFFWVWVFFTMSFRANVQNILYYAFFFRVWAYIVGNWLTLSFGKRVWDKSCLLSQGGQARGYHAPIFQSPQQCTFKSYLRFTVVCGCIGGGWAFPWDEAESHW